MVLINDYLSIKTELKKLSDKVKYRLCICLMNWVNATE